MRKAYSVLFTAEQRNAVILSDAAIAVMVWMVSDACTIYGPIQVIKYYGIPWLMVTHWCKHSFHDSASPDSLV